MFMRKSFCVAAVIFVMVCALWVTGCKDDTEDTKHTDPAFLEGTWDSDNLGVHYFTIEVDLSFECSLEFPDGAGGTIPVTVGGKLDYSSSALGPNDYLLKDMGSEIEMVSTAVSAYNDVAVTLTPNGDKTKFTFTSSNPMAKGFFGGTYTKQQ